MGEGSGRKRGVEEGVGGGVEMEGIFSNWASDIKEDNGNSGHVFLIHAGVFDTHIVISPAFAY